MRTSADPPAHPCAIGSARPVLPVLECPWRCGSSPRSRSLAMHSLAAPTFPPASTTTNASSPPEVQDGGHRVEPHQTAVVPRPRRGPSGRARGKHQHIDRSQQRREHGEDQRQSTPSRQNQLVAPRRSWRRGETRQDRCSSRQSSANSPGTNCTEVSDPSSRADVAQSPLRDGSSRVCGSRS